MLKKCNYRNKYYFYFLYEANKFLKMRIESTGVTDYLNKVPTDKSPALNKLRATILDHLPVGYDEEISYGMIGYVVPLSTYPAGYHCTPNTPLPFASIAAQKNFIGFYHMGLYAMPDLYKWFVQEYPKYSKYKLDMGKSCVRFKRMDDIPYELIGRLMEKVSVADWINTYESAFKK